MGTIWLRSKIASSSTMTHGARERFARKNEEEELRKAFERLDARGYI